MTFFSAGLYNKDEQENNFECMRVLFRLCNQDPLTAGPVKHLTQVAPGGALIVLKAPED